MTLQPEFWTTEKLIDELFLQLARVTLIITDENGNKVTVKKYYRQADDLFKRIPIARPTPEYLIDKADLNEKLRAELLDDITSNEARQSVLKAAVGRIFENLNFDYYHLSVARGLKVRLV